MASKTVKHSESVTGEWCGQERSFVLEGNVRKDGFGRIVIDQCNSDEEHLRSAPTDPEINKPSCRKLLEEFFDRTVHGYSILGKKGRLTVVFKFREDR